MTNAYRNVTEKSETPFSYSVCFTYQSYDSRDN